MRIMTENNLEQILINKSKANLIKYFIEVKSILQEESPASILFCSMNLELWTQK